MKRVRIAAFASGGGSNLRAVDRYLRDLPEPPAEIVLCISNNRKPGAFDYTRDHDIPSVRLSPTMFPDDPEAYAAELERLLDENRIDMILLAGYMRKLPPSVVADYRGRILNIHPALLPKFGGKGMYGIYVHQAVLDAEEKESGATVHLVDEEYDTGSILAQKRVPVFAEDTPEALAARVLAAEHWLLPRVVERSAGAIARGERITPDLFPERSVDVTS